MKDVELVVDWSVSKERILVSVELQKEPTRVQRLYTFESWPAEGKPGRRCYRPGVTAGRLDDGSLVIELRYDRRDHPWISSEHIEWGVSVITLDAEGRSAALDWRPESAEGVGGARPVEVRPLPTERGQQTTQRSKRQQTEFRNLLLVAGSGACALSGETTVEALEAAHLVAVENQGPDVPENGLLLRADLHRLFDAGYFDFDAQDGRVLRNTSKPLSPSYVEQLAEARLSDDDMARVSEFLRRRQALV